MRFFTDRKKLDLSINSIFTSQGIQISISKEGNPVNIPITFTITELKQLNKLDELQLLEDLYADEQLSQLEDGNYMLSYDSIYDFSAEDRELLHLPAATTPISIKLDNKQYVGAPNFEFTPEISSDKYNRLHQIGDRKGAVIELPSKKVLLLEKPFYHFLELLNQQPTNQDSEELMSFVAMVKKEARSLGIELSNYIMNENYEFIDEIDVELERNEEGIDIIPQYKYNALDDDMLKNLSENNSSYIKHDGTRIFVNKKAMESKETIKKMPRIENEEIPRFVQNPDAFYDEDFGISLEDFSDRVKDLKIRVYKAQPFVNGKQNDRGWFEYETGFKITDAEGNEITNQDETYFQNEVEDEFKQIDEHTFVETPYQADQFQKLATKVREESTDLETIQPGLSKYVLEIFENFSQVEYNKPLFILKEEVNKEKMFDVTPPNGFNATLKPFQAEGFKWMKTLRATGNGGLLADDMGLGKTIQVIAYLLYLKEQERLTPTIIVLPKTLIENWINEMNNFAPALLENIYVHRGPGRLKDHRQIASYDLVLTTYHTLTRDQTILGKVDWEMVICDEAQAIKNPSTGNSNVIKALKNKGRLALTGTPVENNLTELWSIIDFVQPGLLGSLNNFRGEYEKRLSEDSAYEEVQSALEERMKYIYLRRTKAIELKGQLPDKKDHPISADIGKEQEKYYQEIISAVSNRDMSGLEAIQKLKMICSHPGLYDENLRNISAKKVPKLQETIDILKSVKAKNEKVIIFTEYRKMQSILKREILEAFQIDVPIINGTTGYRQQIVDQFNRKSGFDILILSPKAAGTGLTITGANHVVHYTRWWNPAVEMQATDRVYRIGQDKEVHVYYPIVIGKSGNNSVEQIIDELIKEKKSLAENVIVPSKGMSIEKEILSQMKIS